jgi:hypothetical protein
MSSTGTGLASRRGRKAIPWRRYWETVLSGVMPTQRPVAELARISWGSTSG